MNACPNTALCTDSACPVRAHWEGPSCRTCSSRVGLCMRRRSSCSSSGSLECLWLFLPSWYIFVPDVVENHLLSHVIPAPADISNDLQNKHMTEDFYVDSPVDLIYKDPSSVFWIPSFVDFAMNQSTGNVGSWNKLLFMFTEFCLNNTTYFTRFSDCIIGINENNRTDNDTSGLPKQIQHTTSTDLRRSLAIC